MKIGIAQIQPIKGNIEKNIALHKTLIKLAISNKIDAVFFSELSITGYEPELAKPSLVADLAKEDRLIGFQELSDLGNIIIGIGVPMKEENSVQIALLIFRPNQPRQKYAKQILHEDEFPYFVEGKEQVLIAKEGVHIAPAICYESLQATHLKKAIDLEANIYLASVAKSQKGIEKAQAYFPKAAKEHSIPILMVNCFGYCDNFLSVGQSMVWNKEGTMIGQLADKETGLLIYDTITERIVELS